MTGVMTLGETMAVLSPSTIGPLRHAPALELSVAGSESNVAVGVRRLGVAATWLGRVGDDELGKLVAGKLRAEGVVTRAVVDSSAPTGLMLKEQRTTSTTRVSYYRAGSAGSRLCSDDIDVIAIREASVLHITGITLAISLSARDAVRYAIEVARGAGVDVSLDVNHRSLLWSEDAAHIALREVMPSVDVLFVGEDEARLIAPDRSGDLQRLADLGPREVLLKRGSAGARALVDGRLYDAPPHDVVSLDPVGAGDAFAAGYLAARCRGLDAEQRVAVASAAGAFAVTVRGDWEGAPDWNELRLLQTAQGHVAR